MPQPPHSNDFSPDRTAVPQRISELELGILARGDVVTSPDSPCLRSAPVPTHACLLSGVGLGKALRRVSVPFVERTSRLPFAAVRVWLLALILPTLPVFVGLLLVSFIAKRQNCSGFGIMHW